MTVYSQREAANWYFGNKAGLDFNSGTPVPLFDGRLETLEGCESFSDEDGNLLFYTDGKIIWNRFHQQMANGDGLKGSFSTTQSALVVPNPVLTNIFYIFTPDDVLSYGLGIGESGGGLTESNGFNYSTVDMAGDAGRGVVSSKNNLLLERAAENVTAVRNFEDNYYWVVTHYQDRFYAYKVDENGVDETPVVSNIGPDIGDYENFRGSIKISPDGTKLAIAHTTRAPRNTGNLYLYDFDSTTGQVSNPLSLNKDRLYYGVEFSSNSSKVYASGLSIRGPEVTDALELVQFDLNAPDIRGSVYLLHRYQSERIGIISGALQLAIDKKIYHSIPGRELSVIRTPNLVGINCDFRPFAVDLGERQASYGLPPFIQSFFETIVTIENFCEGDATTFTTDASGNVAGISWDFGDPASGAQNISTDLNPDHVFSSPDVYTVNMEVTYTNGSTRLFTEFVEIAEIPLVNTSIALVQCDVDGVDDGLSDFNLEESIELFNNGNEDISAFFFETMADAAANLNQLEAVGYRNTSNGQQIYARAFENPECFSIVEINLNVAALSDLGDYAELQVCNEGSDLAIGISVGKVHTFLTSEFAASATVEVFLSQEDALLELEELPQDETAFFGPLDETALFFRVESANACDFIGKLNLEVLFKPEYEEQVEERLCDGNVVLTGPDGFGSYLWSTGETTQSISVDTLGEYELIFGTINCGFSQFYTVVPPLEIEIQELRINDFSTSNSVEVLLVESNDTIRYSLDNGTTFQDSNIFLNIPPGVYDLLVSNDCTSLEKEIVIGAMEAFFTPNNDGINDLWTLSNAQYFPNFQVSIFDRYGTLLRTFGENESGWDGTFKSVQMPSADYWYRLVLGQGRVVKGHFSLKR